MSSTVIETTSQHPPANGQPTVPLPAPPVSDRRKDVDAKHDLIAHLLDEINCDGLLILKPANLAWLTGGAVSRNILDKNEQPALFIMPSQRWLLSCNLDTQRMFDEEMDGLGFLVKEWPWHWPREQLLADLCEGREIACDSEFTAARPVEDRLISLRRSMSPYEQACCTQLGKALAHALEATCRQARQGDSEREIAGQLSHRLVHRGVVPWAISVAADGRSARYRRHGYTPASVNKFCTISATVRKYGLFVEASRSFSFGQPSERIERETLVACKVAGHYVAGSWPDAIVNELLKKGRRIFAQTGFEHEWKLCPQGHLTGRKPIEQSLYPDSEELLQTNSVITWSPTVGSASSTDTYLITPDGPRWITPCENWPLVQVRVSGAEFLRPYLLRRQD